MNLADLIRAEKTKTNLGEWKAGHIPRSAFPLSRVKEKQYRLGPAYSWRLITFIACKLKCRILITLNEEKEIFRARLGVECDNDIVVLCDHEFHAGEPGWHCHVTRKHVEKVPAGVARGGDRRRWPRGHDGSAAFTVTKARAFTIAAELYGLIERDRLL
jgi:hypothetical protein